MNFAKIGTQSLVSLGFGASLSIILPIVIALIWKFRKNEKITTILAGAATFLLFVLILEKPIQNVIIFPAEMGLPDHAVSRYINARPVLWALVAALFPGVFEETGRLVTYKTVLRKRKNRETSVSHGIGHGGFESIILVGLTYISYISYAIMINTGTFQTLIEQTASQSQSQADALTALAGQIASLTIADISVGLAERIISIVFHIAASIIVFYSCKNKSRFWLYPLAIVLHTAMDFVAALYSAKVFAPPAFVIELICALFSALTFCGAYFLLYKKDVPADIIPGAEENPENHGEVRKPVICVPEHEQSLTD